MSSPRPPPPPRASSAPPTAKASSTCRRRSPRPRPTTSRRGSSTSQPPAAADMFFGPRGMSRGAWCSPREWAAVATDDDDVHPPPPPPPRQQYLDTYMGPYHVYMGEAERPSPAATVAASAADHAPGAAAASAADSSPAAARVGCGPFPSRMYELHSWFIHWEYNSGDGWQPFSEYLNRFIEAGFLQKYLNTATSCFKDIVPLQGGYWLRWDFRTMKQRKYIAATGRLAGTRDIRRILAFPSNRDHSDCGSGAPAEAEAPPWRQSSKDNDSWWSNDHDNWWHTDSSSSGWHQQWSEKGRRSGDHEQRTGEASRRSASRSHSREAQRQVQAPAKTNLPAKRPRRGAATKFKLLQA